VQHRNAPLEHVSSDSYTGFKGYCRGQKSPQALWYTDVDMRLLAEISDGTLGIGFKEKMDRPYKLRKNARAILVREDGHIALQYLQNHFFHKLPGGGIEDDESIEQALHREVREEVGCEIRIKKPIGVVIEYRDAHDLLQISYCYIAEVTGALGDIELDQNEVAQGMVTQWVTPKTAIELLEEDKSNMYQGPFIIERELAFLNAYLEEV
jgi:8-oxo-dGTP diphosphatase